ncbi:hypothetical protein [Bdellovibrio bacteriovorus]|uniref:hypothetical protein n=1 Tax=Bdellovibrio bacteriovorus TaxID=959 RepID=UPI0035A70A0A
MKNITKALLVAFVLNFAGAAYAQDSHQGHHPTSASDEASKGHHGGHHDHDMSHMQSMIDDCMKKKNDKKFCEEKAMKEMKTKKK